MLIGVAVLIFSLLSLFATTPGNNAVGAGQVSWQRHLETITSWDLSSLPRVRVSK